LIAELQALPNLESLSLGSIRFVTDEAFGHLIGFSSLRSLHALTAHSFSEKCASLSDIGLERLSGIPRSNGSRCQNAATSPTLGLLILLLFRG